MVDPTEAAAASADATQRLIDQGVLGIVVVILLTTVGFLWRALNAAHTARLSDKDSVLATLTGLAEKSTTALVSSASVSEHNSEMMREIRDALRALSDLVRSEGVGRRPSRERDRDPKE